MPTDSDPTPSRTKPSDSIIGRSSAAGVAVSSIIAAASSYLVLMISARVLTQADNAEFLAFWSLMFGVFGITTGLQPEYTRQAVLSRSKLVRTSGGGWRLGIVALGVGVAVGGLVLATSALWAPTVLGDKSFVLSAVVAGGVLGHALQMGLTGTLAGSQRWAEYSLLIAVEAVARIGLVVLCLWLVPSVEGFAFASAVSTFVWILGLFGSPTVRRAFSVRSTLPLKTLMTGIIHASTSTMSSAILVVGFPVLLRLTTPEAEFLTTAPLLMAAALTRAPLMVPLMTYQSVAVAHFMKHRDKGLKALWAMARIISVIGGGGAVLAGLLGPWLMEVLLGPGYRLDGASFAGLTIGAALLAALTLSGALCAALGRHAVYSGGWLAATVLSLVTLFAPLEVETRAVFALIVGPGLGIIVHIVALRGIDKSANKLD